MVLLSIKIFSKKLKKSRVIESTYSECIIIESSCNCSNITKKKEREFYTFCRLLFIYLFLLNFVISKSQDDYELKKSMTSDSVR